MFLKTTCGNSSHFIPSITKGQEQCALSPRSDLQFYLSVTMHHNIHSTLSKIKVPIITFFLRLMSAKSELHSKLICTFEEITSGSL